MSERNGKLPALNGVSISKIEIVQNGDLSIEFDLPTPPQMQKSHWRTDIVAKRTFDVYDDPELLAAAQALFRLLQARVADPDPVRVGIDCMRCKESRCCREYDVFIDGEDVARLMDHLGQDLETLEARHIDRRPDWSGDYAHRLRRVKDEEGEDRCTFLLRDAKDGHMRCSIYAARPNLCRSFDEHDCTLFDGDESP